jgi:hypothetical protein
MSTAGMNLRTWTSNSNLKAMETIAAADNVLNRDVIMKILGMKCDQNRNEISFVERNIPILYIFTKRTIFQYSS